MVRLAPRMRGYVGAASLCLDGLDGFDGFDVPRRSPRASGASRMDAERPTATYPPKVAIDFGRRSPTHRERFGGVGTSPPV